MQQTSSIHTNLLVRELYLTFQEAGLTNSKAHFTAIVDCFLQILHLPTKELDRISLAESLKVDLINSFEGNKMKQRQALQTLTLNITSWLRKLLWLLHPEKYHEYEYKDYNRGPGAYYKYFGMLPPHPRHRQVNSFPLQRQMKAAYQWHIMERHTAPALSNTALTQRVHDVWVCYLYPVVKHFAHLQKVIAQHQLPNLRPYLKLVRRELQDWKSRFVSLKGYELAYTYGKSIKRITNNTIANLPQKSIAAWREEIIQQAHNNKTAPSKNMLLLGTAGSGKSKTMMMMALEDAVQKTEDYKNLNRPIPIFLRLNRWPKQIDIISYIAQLTKLSTAQIKTLLKEGYMRLYLDGLDEISTKDGIRGKREKEIQQLLADYPKTFVLISMRPEANIPFRHVRVFELLPLNQVEIVEFLTKNTDRESTRQLMRQAIQVDRTKEWKSIEQAHFFQLIQNPLLLFYLIQVVDFTKNIPTSEEEIIRVFIDHLLSRERYDKHNTVVVKQDVLLLLDMLGYYSILKYERNVGMSVLWVESTIQKLIQKYQLSLSSTTFLQLVTGLNILRLERNQYAFSHQVFQDFFCSQAELRLFMEEEAADNMEIMF